MDVGACILLYMTVGPALILVNKQILTTYGFGCRAALSAEAYACPRCSSAFCADCDEFVHTVLHNCPGCCAPSGGGS